MKKTLKFILGALFAATLFISCGKAPVDEYGCFQQMEPALKNAQKKNQDVLVMITMNGDDDYSAKFINDVVAKDDFKKEILANYSTVLMDFSQTAYQKTVAAEDAKDKEKKAAEELATIIQNNSKLVSLLNVQTPPAFFIFTKDQYYITEIVYSDDIADVAAFKALIDEKASIINDAHTMVEATKKGTDVEKAKAIDELFEATNPSYRNFLSDLIEKVVELDKNNETGLLSKYILAGADSKAQNAFMTGDTEGASQVYIDICSKEELTPEHKQQAYYMAAYILAMSGSTEYQKIVDTLQLAVEADPENESVASIKQIIESLSQTLEARAEEDTAGAQ